MKKLLLVLSFVFMGLSASSQDDAEQMPNMPAQLPQPVSNVSQDIRQQVMRLEGIADRVSIYKVTPSKDVKAMMLEYALNERIVESEEEFNDRWVGNDSSAWDGDSGYFGLDDLSGAKSYVQFIVEQNFEDLGRNDEDAPQFAKNYFTTKYAFEYLGRNSNFIKVGVTPNGAVQCGFSFQALLIIDMKEGFVYEVVMEGSGC